MLLVAEKKEATSEKLLVLGDKLSDISFLKTNSAPRLDF